MKNAHSASILTIGTELTTGQIMNTNAKWLSERLTDLGVEVVLHQTVADERAEIRAALEYCQQQTKNIFVVGGLGPTTDDFTREVIAEWIGKPLQFHEPSWKWVVERLSARGVQVVESQRQQCFFPQSATVIHNQQGTANAFFLEYKDANVWTLPGPPLEIAAIWESELAQAVRNKVPGGKPVELFTWQCLGKSEAELGELTEEALKGSGFKIGYRAYLPYVEIKVWCSISEKATHSKKWFDQLEAAIGPWLVTRQGEDLAKTFLERLPQGQPIRIADALTGGILTERLGIQLRKPEFQSLASRLSIETKWSGESSKATLSLNLSERSNTLDLAGLKLSFQVPSLIDRMRRITAELALKNWADWLAEK